MNESEEVGDKTDKRWWVVNAEQYSFSCVGIFRMCILYVMEAHRQTAYLKTACLFPCMTFSYYKRIFASEEGVKKKKKTVLLIILLLWHFFLCPPVLPRKILVLIEYFFSNV